MESVKKQEAKFKGTNNIPEDLIFASASGLDPDISVEGAKFQIDRIVKARGFDDKKKQMLLSIVEKSIINRDLLSLNEIFSIGCIR